MRTKTGMATQILDTQTWTQSSPLMAIDLCELGQVWVSAFPCIKWDFNYPAHKILVRSRDSIQVPRKVFGMEDKLLNVTILMMVNTVVLVMMMIIPTKMLVVILLFIFSNFSTDNHDYYHLGEKKWFEFFQILLMRAWFFYSRLSRKPAATDRCCLNVQPRPHSPHLVSLTMYSNPGNFAQQLPVLV